MRLSSPATLLLFLFWPLAVASGVRAAGREDPRLVEMIEVHSEAIGGRARMAALQSLRSVGHVMTGGVRLNFRSSAARPNLIRLESESGARTRVQGFAGEAPAREMETGAGERPVRPMSVAAAKTFVADAEFDDPPVAGAARGYEFDLAGEQER